MKCLQTEDDGAILDPDDLVCDVADDKDKVRWDIVRCDRNNIITSSLYWRDASLNTLNYFCIRGMHLSIH